MILESPSNPNANQEVDQTHQAARISLRPWEHGGAQYGQYRVSARSGVLTGTGVDGDGPVFSLRWTDTQVQFVLQFLEAYYIATGAFTAAQEISLGAVLASAFTVADSSGSAISLAAAGRVRKSMAVSKVNDMRIGDTTKVTAGTRTLDGFDFVQGGGLVNDPNIAAGTEQIHPNGRYGFTYALNMAAGEHPIVLGANEGIVIRNKIVFPAAGNCRLFVNVGWMEVPAL